MKITPHLFGMLFLSPLLSVCVKTTEWFPCMFTHVWSMLHVIMGWNQIRKNYWNDKHGLSIAWRDIDVFFLCNFEAHTWDWRTECCYLHNNIVSNSLKKPAIIYLYHQPQPNLIFKARYCFCSSRTRCWIKSIASTLRFNLFICFCVFCGCLLEPRGFIKYEVYQTFSAQLFWRASVIHHWQLHRHESVSAGTGAMHFWKWFMRSKINNVAWSACKVQPLNGSVAD